MVGTLTLTALHALINLSSPRIAPNGSDVAYVSAARDYRDDRNVSSLLVVRSDGTHRITIDAGPFVSSPRWSPDGTRLAYLRHTLKDDNDQIVVYRIVNGARSVITHAPNGVQHFAWSPDGTRFVYDTPDNEPNAYTVAAKHHDDTFLVSDDDFLTTKPPTPSHLWLVSSAGGTARRLTHGTWSFYEGVAPFVGGPSDPSWSSDGKSIVITRSPDAHDARTDRSSIAVVDASTGATHDIGSIRAYAYEPAFAPTGSAIAYLRPHGPGPVSALDVVVGSAQNGDGTDVTTTFDRDVQSVQWVGDSLILTAPDGMHRAIYRLPHDGAPQRVDIGSLNASDVDAGPHGELAFIGSELDRAPELYFMSRDGTAPRALTHVNMAISALHYGRAETVSWTAADGQTSEGLLFHPVDEQPGRRYPLLIWHHGGPEAAIDDAFDEGTDESQPVGELASARGWFALLPNYRGSDDLGTSHEHAIFKDPGTGPMSDTMAGVTAVETSEPIDTSRVCVGGHSYGGFMAAWIMGHDTRWRCGVVADGAVDWVQEYDLSGTGNLAWARDSLGGSPWQTDSAQIYHDGSPITYATQIRTPTLLLTGLDDEVVPFTETWTLYHAPRDNNVPVTLVAIPTAHHTPHDPVRLDRYERYIFDWLARYL